MSNRRRPMPASLARLQASGRMSAARRYHPDDHDLLIRTEQDYAAACLMDAAVDVLQDVPGLRDEQIDALVQVLQGGQERVQRESA